MYESIAVCNSHCDNMEWCTVGGYVLPVDIGIGHFSKFTQCRAQLALASMTVGVICDWEGNRRFGMTQTMCYIQSTWPSMSILHIPVRIMALFTFLISGVPENDH